MVVFLFILMTVPNLSANTGKKSDTSYQRPYSNCGTVILKDEFAQVYYYLSSTRTKTLH